MNVRVLLVDDQALFREALRTLLDVQDGIEVVGEAGDGAAALEQAAAVAPDVVLMDLRMPGMGGVAATRALRVDAPQVQVIALTTFDDDEDVFAALRAGAIGYLLKDVSSARLVEAVHAAARGESFLQRWFTTEEIAYCRSKAQPALHLAARLAAKEAVAKALGAPAGMRWHDCEIVSDPDGRPWLTVSGTVAAVATERGVNRWHLSLSHDGGIASAMVVAET